MPDVSMIAGGVLLGAVAGLVFYLTSGRRETVVFEDEREERLTHRLADRLGCPLAAALDAVRREIAASLNQDDATILKRAEYHYRRDLPERGACGTYRDRAPG